MPSTVRIVRKATGGSAAPGSTSATPAAESSAAATPREGSSDDTPAPDVSSLIEKLNYADAPRPFKNPNYAQKIAGNRRVKTAKQIVQLERERYVKPKKKARAAATAASQSVTAAGTPVDGMDVDDEAAQAAAAAEASFVEPEVVRKEEYIAYHEYEAPPSLRPAKKYCDITGLEAPYTDPKSRLRYHNADIYELLKSFSSGAEQEYLMLRGQGMVIR